MAGTPVLDGALTEWTEASRIQLLDPGQIVQGAKSWSGIQDLSGAFYLRADSTHLYLAGWVQDDHFSGDQNPERADCLELHLSFAAEGDAASLQAEESPLVLRPMQPLRPWSWLDPGRVAAQQAASQLAGIQIAAVRLDPNRYSFEAAIPFHHFATLRPGARLLGFNLVLRDRDPGDEEPGVTMSWTGLDPAQPKSLCRLELPPPGPLVSVGPRGAFWSRELLADLPYLLVPLATLAGLVFLLRGWASVRARTRWLRPVLVGCGMLTLLLGLCLPTLLGDWRRAAQRERIDSALGRLHQVLGQLEAGTLGSYRGASRDRALMDLLAGRSIARQRYTSYRSLAQLAPDQFGPPLRSFDDLPVRDYWLPLAPGRQESFQFDPPLRGSRLHVVVGRQFVPPFSFAARTLGATLPRLDLELDFGVGDKRRVVLDLNRPFTDCQSLGRESWEAIATPVPLERDLRAVAVVGVQGVDLHLVGMSLEGLQAGQVEPLLLGAPTRQGVLTDLRGPFPLDAGIELAPGATAKVVVPRLTDPPQRLWFVYRAVYPRLATANPGARVGEIVLHFGDGRPKRTLVLEHQVSMFYELAMHNTRDDPPDGAPASIALSWVDDKQERHVNLGYPVLDLPAEAPVEAIEFRNFASYRMQFRSVVFVNERSAAPQDPPDSPLVRVGTQERQLRPAVREELRGVALSIYRAGRLSESTLPIDQQQVSHELPRAVAMAETTATEELLADGARRASVFTPLGGDGWDGAVLAVADVDREWSLAAQFASRLGLGLCLLSAPFLLVLLSELLAAATNLRLRLMAVTMTASLAPLGLLSLVLVQVLEGGHAAEVEQATRTVVRSALEQLDNQKVKVRASAQQWLGDLATLVGSKLQNLDEAQFAAAAPAIATELQKLLAGQLPPEWSGGFLRLEWAPRLGKVAPAAVVLVAGDERMADVEAPARLDPGVFMQWGVLLLGVRAEQAQVGGAFVLTAARPLDANLLGALAPGLDVILTDVRGYPVAIHASRPESAPMLRQSTDPARMAQREQALRRGLEQREPVVERGGIGDDHLVYGSDVVRDLQGTPRALLTVAKPAQRATLDLAVGRIPVRAFFLLVAGSLVVLSVFLSFVVSSRISRPIEGLELGAQALSRGQFDTRVPVADGGQIGRLTRAFNQMASDLQARLIDLQTLNRTMCELAAGEDEGVTLAVLLRFCTTQTPADVVRVVLVDPTGNRLLVHTGNQAEVQELPVGSLSLTALPGAFSCVSRRGELPSPWSAVVPNSRSLLGLPIVFGGQARGVVVLGFTRVPPLTVDLDLLSTVVAQAAVALERGLLQRLSIQDPVTATFTPDYFRRRVVDEVSLAQQRSHPLAMLALVLGDGDRRPRGLRRFAEVLRATLPGNAVLSHIGTGHFQVALPGVTRLLAEELVARIATAWIALAQQLPENEVVAPAPRAVVVQFPDEAASAEFLFDAVRERLGTLGASDGAAVESDEDLHRAGVTAISPAMREVYRTLRRIAPTDLPILLEGETGVGKEVLTNLLHRWSRRANGPLVKVHCAALSETLLVSELFGHEKGAFTGADRRKLGRFELADGGTLFLDEVGEIPLDVQVKLLRVLQEGEVDRVGGSESVRVDVRVVAATNRDIARMVAAGTFREDLYYRLQGMVVHVPPLRERKQELATLVEQFRGEISSSGDVSALAWSTDAMDELYRHDWPGNIRQLRNTVFRAMVMARADVVQRRDVLAALSSGAAVSGAGSSVGAAGAAVDVAIPSPALSSTPGLVPSAAGGAVAPEGALAVASALASAPAPSIAATVAGAMAAEAKEPVVEIPRQDAGFMDVAPVASAVAALASPTEPAAARSAPASALPARLQELLARVLAAGSYATQDHMVAGGLSHRTALRDLQALVQAGCIERVGSRRGAFYRPTPVADRFLKTTQALANSSDGAANRDQKVI